jgi:hypothetical protein
MNLIISDQPVVTAIKDRIIAEHNGPVKIHSANQVHIDNLWEKIRRVAFTKTTLLVFHPVRRDVNFRSFLTQGRAFNFRVLIYGYSKYIRKNIPFADHVFYSNWFDITEIPMNEILDIKNYRESVYGDYCICLNVKTRLLSLYEF